jgi:hypothetical protein
LHGVWLKARLPRVLRWVRRRGLAGLLLVRDGESSESQVLRGSQR